MSKGEGSLKMGHFSDPEFVTFVSNDDPNSLREPHKLQYRTKGMVIKMIEYIVAILIGIMCVVIGILNMGGNVSMLHSYHRERVKEEDIRPFGRLVGLGMMIVGAGIIAGGVMSIIAFKLGNKTLDIIGMAILGVGLAVGIGIAFYAMKKYNKGIF